jgi:predicted ribosome quality control (RQC) complex YloA/Tae2 family protein
MLSLHQHVSLFPLLAKDLQHLLLGFQLKDAFRVQQHELNLIFQKDQEQISLRINTEAKTGLFFFYEYPIERNGTVFPLFQDLIGSKISLVQAHQNNRSFEVVFENNQALVFKMYGPLANVIWFDNNQAKQLFRAGIENDFHLKREEFSQTNSSQELPVFEGNYYVYQLSPHQYGLGFKEEFGLNQILKTEVIFEALNTFSGNYLQGFIFLSEQQKLVARFKQKLKREHGLLTGANAFLNHALTATPYEEIGHILMANLHEVKKGEKEVTLNDFYRDQPIIVTLKKDLSPQDNAAQYYQKARNRAKEIPLKQKQVEVCSIKIKELEETLNQISAAKSLRELRPWIKDEKRIQDLPLKEKFRRFECLGFAVYVGKNAVNNDELTLKFAHKDDLWLHAKGVSGSHVIIKHQQLKPFPPQVIEFAAQIAAHYSSSRNSQLVPVIYTPKKFVRKPKGAHPGQVAVEREEILMVEPKIDI